MLAKSNWSAIPTDKDGGFALIPKEVLEQDMIELMESSSYREVEVPLSSLSDEVCAEYIALAKSIGKIQSDMQLSRSLLADLSDPLAMYQLLKVNLKTHKPAGKVKYRAIHSTKGSPFKPGMRFLSKCLQPAIDDIDFLLKDSFEFVSKVRGRTSPPDTTFIKLDVKDFFMTGKHHEIIEGCAGHVDPKYERSFRDMCSFILSSQFVKPGFADRAWQVREGTGMGLSCSGDLSNILLWTKMEKGFVDDLEVKTKYMIWAYMRYMDDIWIAARTGQCWREFVAMLQARAAPFILEVDEISDHGVQMLDIWVSKGEGFRRTRRLDTVVRPTPTSIGIPLNPTSLHPGGVHSGWPRSLLSRFRSLSSDRRACEEVVTGFKNLWTEHGVLVPQQIHQAKCSCADKPPSTRLIFPFAEQWSNANFGRVFRQYEDQLRAALEGTSVPHRLTVAWSLGGTHLVNSVQRGNHSPDEGMRISAGFRRNQAKS